MLRIRNGLRGGFVTGADKELIRCRGRVQDVHDGAVPLFLSDNNVTVFGRRACRGTTSETASWRALLVALAYCATNNRKPLCTIGQLSGESYRRVVGQQGDQSGSKCSRLALHSHPGCSSALHTGVPASVVTPATARGGLAVALNVSVPLHRGWLHGFA